MGQASGRSNRSGLVALVLMRGVYGINWLNIGSVFSAMALDFGQGAAGLGSLSSSFYLGVGLWQVPGGLLAARWGARRVVFLGTLLYSLGVLVCAGSPVFMVAVASRFVVGAGMALVFAPAVVLVTKMLGRETSGLGVGLFNSAFNVGGFLGLFAWGVLAASEGWRPSLALSGGLGLVTALLVLARVPERAQENGGRVSMGDFRAIVGSFRLVLLGVGLLSLTAGNSLIGSFMYYYLEKGLGVSALQAGAVSSLVVVVPIFSSLIGGRLYDRVRRPGLLLLVIDCVMALAVAIASVPSVFAATAGAALGGLMTGFGFTVGFAGAKDINPTPSAYDSLAVGWVNSISLFGAFWPPLLFSYLVGAQGYSAAWLASGALTFAIGLPLLMFRGRAGPRAA